MYRASSPYHSADSDYFLSLNKKQHLRYESFAKRNILSKISDSSQVNLWLNSSCDLL